MKKVKAVTIHNKPVKVSKKKLKKVAKVSAQVDEALVRVEKVAADLGDIVTKLQDVADRLATVNPQSDDDDMEKAG